MGPDDELIFVEGNSTDDTWETICRLQEQYEDNHRIHSRVRTGKEKAMRFARVSLARKKF